MTRASEQSTGRIHSTDTVSVIERFYQSVFASALPIEMSIFPASLSTSNSWPTEFYTSPLKAAPCQTCFERVCKTCERLFSWSGAPHYGGTQQLQTITVHSSEGQVCFNFTFCPLLTLSKGSLSQGVLQGSA